MQVVATIAAVREQVRSHKAAGRTVALVPTMGALHAGHGQLVAAASRSADVVVVSIFVNPTQFAPHEDFGRYPRTPEADQALCEQNGAALIFAPEVAEVYPRGGAAMTFVEVPELSTILEGKSRPTHFRGVTTVVMKLLQMVGPDVAWFGQKDFQQALLIRRMVADLDVPVRLEVAETVREPDGLAMSSRNRYLSPDERQAATILSKALFAARDRVRAGERDADRVRHDLAVAIESKPRAQLDYAEVADIASLRPSSTIEPGRSVALVAARVGPARLIDNVLLG